jgi:hypothetical protein
MTLRTLHEAAELYLKDTHSFTWGHNLSIYTAKERSAAADEIVELIEEVLKRVNNTREVQ